MPSPPDRLDTIEPRAIHFEVRVAHLDQAAYRSPLGGRPGGREGTASAWEGGAGAPPKA